MSAAQTVTLDSAVEPKIQEALTRAARWRVLELLVSPPASGYAQAVAELLPPADRQWEPLAIYVSCDDALLSAAHFGTLGPRGGVTACASDYVGEVSGGMADKGPVLADAAGFYKAFGFVPSHQETPDHFSVMFEFLAFLAMKEAYALADADGEQAEIAAEAGTKFIKRHIKGYVSAFAERLARASVGEGPYAGVAEILTLTFAEPE